MKSFSTEISKALYGALPRPDITAKGRAGLPSWFDVTGLCVASIGAAIAEIAALSQADRQTPVKLDRKLASLWFQMTLRPEGWTLPPVWDDIAGLYKTEDGWLRLHTNAPYHKAAALDVLQCAPDKASVAAILARYKGEEIEAALIENGTCAAKMRGLKAWQTHPQGQAVHCEPLIAWDIENTPWHGASPSPQATLQRPLQGLKILDCTRVLAGPVCTRFLAGYGADVLRIDPPGWAEDNVVPEIMLGKRSTTLNLKTRADRDIFLKLLSKADLFIHGYRADALESLGLGHRVRRDHNAQLIDITLNAYGWSGPWRNRRGYDSLVQMSTGIVHFGLKRCKTGKPTPLPVQALDHATGYLMAASAVRALRLRQSKGLVATAKLSLARTANLLIETAGETLPSALPPESKTDLAATLEATDWGPAKRIRFPVLDETLTPHWDRPAGRLHSAQPEWVRAD